MAEEQVGLLQRLTGFDGSEEAAARQVIGQNIQQGGRLTSAFYGLGQGIGQLGIPIRGLVSGISGGRVGGDDSVESKGFRANFAEGVQSAQDGYTAAVLGIDPVELKANRAIREALSSGNFKDDGTPSARIKMAERAVEVANAIGAPGALAKAMQTLTDLRKEEKSFSTLMAEREANLQDRITEDAILDGKPITGIQAVKDGVHGLNYQDEAGNMVFKPWGSGLYRDIGGRAGESPDARIRKAIPKEDSAKMRGLVQTNAQALGKFDRVMSTMIDLQDDAGAVIGDSGRWLSWADNFTQNMKETIRAFGPGRAGMARDAVPNEKRGWSGMTYWRGLAADASNEIWQMFELPDWARGASAAAQQHRAQIMELAYMAARLAEPSNRGLSDNDIQNALARISGDTSNPQVIMRRFVEILHDSATELDNNLKSYYGSFEGITNSQIDEFFGGELIGQYRSDLQRIYDKFGVTIDGSGRAIFDSVIGPDVGPGGNVSTGLQQPDQPESDDEFLNRIFEQQ